MPARGGSKGIPRKNVYPLCGKPLIQYTLEAACCRALDDLIVTTDDHEIATVCRCAPHVLMRPPELAQDDTPTLPVIRHAVEWYSRRYMQVDAVMILQPTSPLRTAVDINAAIAMFEAGDSDSLVSVCEGIHPIKSYDGEGKPFLDQMPYDKHRHRCYTRNGAIFITRKDLLNSGRLIGAAPLLYKMPKTRSVDIDDIEDLAIAEALLKCGHS